MNYLIKTLLFELKGYFKCASLFLACLVISSVIANKVMDNGTDNYTDLMKAIHDKQHPAYITGLIDQGADVNACDEEFLRHVKPVLRYALDRGTDKESVEIIKILIAAGADVNEITYNRVMEENLYGFMPLLTYATIYSSAEIVQILIDAGAQDKVVEESPISFKKTALMIAQELGKTNIVNILGQINLSLILR